MKTLLCLLHRFQVFLEILKCAPENLEKSRVVVMVSESNDSKDVVVEPFPLSK